jgi:hypothetical protein
MYMAALTQTPIHAPSNAPRHAPWYVWCAVLAVTSALIGGHWDVSWHTSIGRDTFWTPAHMAIYLCGVLAALSCAYLIFHMTFFGRPDDPGVTIAGFRGPLGAFIAAWGGIAMLTSAPFDNWWHDAYGLDVKIVSPPHVVLLAGVFAVAMGGLILTLGYMNRAEGAQRRQLEWMFLYVGGLLIVLLQFVSMEYLNRILLHTSLPYRIMAALIPFVLAGVWRASRYPFSCTVITSIYSLLIIGLILILPLFPAQPKLGPVYHAVTQFIPPQFPILLIVPAFLLDLLWQRTRRMNRWLLSAISGILFVGVLLAVEWPFATFLMTPTARNAFFGAGYMGYFAHPNSYTARSVFYPLDSGLAFWCNIAWAICFAAISTRVGIAWGEWMKRVRR